MPVTGRVLLDTNILIALLAAEQAVVERVRAAEAVYVPIIALGELYYGARKSARVAENTVRVAAFARLPLCSLAIARPPLCTAR